MIGTFRRPRVELFFSSTATAAPFLSERTAERRTSTAVEALLISTPSSLSSMSAPSSSSLALFDCVDSQPATIVGRCDHERDSGMNTADQPNPPLTYALRPVGSRRAEDLLGGALLDDVAEVHERGAIGDPVGLLEVVGDDHDRHLRAQLHDLLLDHRGRDRVERRAGLVEQQDLRPHRERAGDAEPLLLAAGERQRGMVEVVLDLFPEPGAAGARRRRRARAADLPRPLRAARAQPVGDVVEDAHRERVRLLEEHADAAAQLGHVEAVDVVAVEQDRAAAHRGRGQVDEPVEGAQQRRLAAAGGADQRQHLALAHVQRNLVDRELLPVGDAQVLGAHPLHGAVALRLRAPCRRAEAGRRHRRAAAVAVAGRRGGDGRGSGRGRSAAPEAAGAALCSASSGPLGCLSARDHLDREVEDDDDHQAARTPRRRPSRARSPRPPGELL